MTVRTPPAAIRNLRPEDEDRLLEICYLTGTTTLDRYLFGLRWCLYYLWYQPQNSFAAADAETDEMLGYILGALDTAKMEQDFQEVMVPKIKGYWRQKHPKSTKTWAGYLKLRLTESGLFKDLYPEYPAHLHINLHPGHQRKGLGRQLMAAYEANLAANNIGGYHLGVGANNHGAIAFYQKLGLVELKAFPQFGPASVIAYGKKL